MVGGIFPSSPRQLTTSVEQNGDAPRAQEDAAGRGIVVRDVLDDERLAERREQRGSHRPTLSCVAPRLDLVRVLIAGSGGREHALAWRARQERPADRAARRSGESRDRRARHLPPGARRGRRRPARARARSLEIDLAVIGPEAPLVAGWPTSGCARGHLGLRAERRGRADRGIEDASRRRCMAGSGRPDRRRRSTTPAAPCVVKADGLAAGKGVFVCRTQGELDAGARGGAGARSATSSSRSCSRARSSRSSRSATATRDDPARRRPATTSASGDGDTGPNTGGMGSFSPVPGFGAAEVEELVERDPRARVLEQLARRASPFVGVALRRADADRRRPAGARVQLPVRRPRDAVDAAADSKATCSARSRPPRPGIWAARDFTRSPARGGDRGRRRRRVPRARATPAREIEGIEAAEAARRDRLPRGTARQATRLVTNGGRILGVTGVADDLERARAIAYEGAAAISFPGARYRTDIALRQATRVG